MDEKLHSMYPQFCVVHKSPLNDGSQSLHLHMIRVIYLYFPRAMACYTQFQHGVSVIDLNLIPSICIVMDVFGVVSIHAY